MDAIIEDKPPMLRFEQGAVEDRIKSEQTKKTEYMNVDIVHISAWGDNKCEVPDICRKTAYDAFTKTVDVKRKVPRYVEDEETGDIKEIIEEVTVPEERTFYEAKIVHPWLDKLADRLKNKNISKDYHDYCVKAYNNWKQGLDMPIDGFPLVDWRGAPEDVKKKAMDLGLNSVEQVADMTEEAMKNIGMGASSMRNKARAFIAEASDPEKNAAEVESLRAKSEDQQEQISELQKKLNEIAGQKVAAAPAEPATEAPKKKPGRPKKEEN